MKRLRFKRNPVMDHILCSTQEFPMKETSIFVEIDTNSLITSIVDTATGDCLDIYKATSLNNAKLLAKVGLQRLGILFEQETRVRQVPIEGSQSPEAVLRA